MSKFKQIDQLCEEGNREKLIIFLEEYGLKNPHKQADIYIEQYNKRSKDMGCRGTIEIWECGAAPKSEERPVVLYTHWGAYEMIFDVINVLKKKERWNDPAYLSRMIFCEMIKDDVSGATGFGIMTDNALDTEHEVVVDIDRQEVVWKRNGKDNITYTFTELIESGVKS